MSLHLKQKMAGRYKIEACNAQGQRRTLADWFPNLITTAGANAIGGGEDVIVSCVVGSGNTPPAITDTTLESQVASGNRGGVAYTTQSSPPYYGTTTCYFIFPAGTATGNLSEIGVGSDNPTPLFSRALILDSSGSPTTITVLPNESLSVTYQLNNYVPTEDVTGTIDIAGVSYAYTLRAALCTSADWCFNPARQAMVYVGPSPSAYNGPIGDITSSPSGQYAFGTAGNSGYAANSFSLQTGISFSIAQGNLPGGIASVYCDWGGLGIYQVGFDPPIPKDSSHALTLSMSLSWAINTP